MVKDLSKKFKGSPYDSSGMPLAANKVDMDKKEDVAKATVHDKYVAPRPLFTDSDPDFQPEPKRTKVDPAKFNSAIELPKKAEPSVKKEEKAADTDDFLKKLKDA